MRVIFSRDICTSGAWFCVRHDTDAEDVLLSKLVYEHVARAMKNEKYELELEDVLKYANAISAMEKGDGKTIFSATYASAFYARAAYFAKQWAEEQGYEYIEDIYDSSKKGRSILARPEQIGPISAREP
jgi:hypothetical protein